MTRALPCLRCGHEGLDVSACLVDLEVEAKADGTRIRNVEVEQVIEHRHITERIKSVVPERFGTEWRCRDRVACAERYREISAEPESAPVEDKEVPSWL